MIRFALGTFPLLTLALFLGAPRTAHAAESYDSCTGFITSIPAVIDTPGTWCLKKDLASATSGAILITSDNVTIDCNDFKLDGLAAGPGTTARGIYANRRHTIVRHCNIRGFYVGVELDDIVAIDGTGGGGGNVVEDNRFDYNTLTGIWVEGNGSVVRRNRVFETGGSTASPFAEAIRTRYSVDVLDNTVSGVRATSGGGATGIILEDDSGGSIIGNRVRELQGDGVGSPDEVAIGDINSNRVVLRNNVVVGNADVGSIGLNCSYNGIAKDNVINGFATGIATCSVGGGNEIVP